MIWYMVQALINGCINLLEKLPRDGHVKVQVPHDEASL